MLLFCSTLLLPLILGVISYIFYKDKVTNKELALLFGTSIVSFLIMNFAMREYNVADTRYYSKQITSVRYYEPWNEWVKRTCSRTRCSGSGKYRHCHTTYYDCSFQRNHSEKWVKRTGTGREYDIDKVQYSNILNMWGGQRTFVDMHRHYHTKDGDAFQTNWNNDLRTTEVVTESQSYENRTLTANTLFHHKPFEEGEAENKGLYDYPVLSRNEQNVIINHPNLPDHVRRYYNKLNTISENHRVFILYFKNKPRKTAFEQKRHWQGGNDNELVICVGIDNTNNVTWVEPFSWCSKPMVEVQLKSYFSQNPDFNLEKLYPHLNEWMKKDWKKRDFHDFDYIDIELTHMQIVWLWIILSIINIGFTAYIIKNEFER